MSNCSNCGAEYNENDTFCGECGAPINSSSNKSSLDYKTFVALSEGEVKVKTYHCTTLKKPQGEGFVTVTNKRVIFHAFGKSGGGSSKLVSEVPIETISGVRTYFGTGINIMELVLGILFSLISLFFMFNKTWGVFSEFGSKISIIPLAIFLTLAIVFLLKFRKVSYELSVYSTGANGSPINFGDGSFGNKLTGQGAAATISAFPSEDTVELMREIGAIILDFKSMGDHAIEKWAPDITIKSSQDKIEKEKSSTSCEKSDEEFFK
ncbi:zinc ribbon domain-containing protein [Clostridium hydrogenum]|uniref:zinc ribbon domain-containing protein n=1 Tax=Clostridium hydrogenum TaxID=2855764 RepID=UPI001F2F7DB8|nr:zinc ribbon domain-containing protein [Clostridium hydrogenum]